MKHSRPASSRRQRGLSLIEVLIAMLVMAIGLLGIAAMQAVTLRNSQSAFDRTQAVVLTYSMLDRMRANATAARANPGYTMTEACAVPTGTSTLVQNDQRLWIQSIKDTMGNAATSCGTITCASGICSITVRWNDSRATNGVANQALTTTSRI